MRSITNDSRRRTGPLRTTVLALAISASGVLAVGGPGAASVAQAGGLSEDDWLGILNDYRSQSGLAPVVENGSWSAGARNHSCWMLHNGIAHDEPAGTPFYTSSGDAAGNASNVAVSGSSNVPARYFIDLWMTAPFHAIGMLRNSLKSTGFGSCASTATSPWKSGGTLDVIRGNDWSVPDPSSPIVFPGDGATTRLNRFIAESPDPRTFCGWSGRSVGLPLIALMPADVTWAAASLSGPSGPIETCVLNQANTSGTAKSILGGDDAVVVVPGAPLQTGTHTVSVSSTGGNVTWTFNVDPNAPLGGPAPAPQPTPEPEPEPEPAPLPELRDTSVLSEREGLTTVAPFRFADSRHNWTISRIPAGTSVRFQVASKRGIPTDASSISANFTVDRASASGYLTVSDCSTQDVSTLNYTAGEAVANQAIVPLSATGELCVYSHAAADVVIDINGWATSAGDQKLTPISPVRIVDTRPQSPLGAKVTKAFHVAGSASPVPLDATAVVVNLTAADPKSSGWMVAYPCDAGQPDSSTLNVRAGSSGANSAIVPLSAEGTICIRSTTATDILIDVTGWVGPTGEYDVTPLRPMRITDTRSLHPDLNPDADGKPLRSGEVLRIPVAGIRGIPAYAKAATLNVTATGSERDGYLKVLPCGHDSNTSTLNFKHSADRANGTTIKLGADGDVCVTTSETTHVIIDITAVWS